MNESLFYRVLIGLDGSTLDKTLGNYLKWIQSFCPEMEAYFIQVVPSLEIPEFALPTEVSNKNFVPLDEKIEKQMYAFASEILKDKAELCHYNAIEGNITRELLRWIEVKEIDLALLGMKTGVHSTGVSTKRFLRKSNCSVWFVPENAPTQINQILVATDFSSYSDAALSKAIGLAKQFNPSPSIELLHVFNVPTDFQYRLSNTYTQYAEIVRENMTSYMNDYIKRFQDELEDVDINSYLIQNKSFNVAKHIKLFVKEKNPELIVMGALGHTALSSLMLGSVTERMVNLNESFPLLIVRLE